MAEEIVVKPPVVLETVVVQDPVTVSVTALALLLTGEGPPPSDLNSSVGDQYLDIASGVLYKLYPEGV